MTIIIGLTGSIGMGKTTVSKMFLDLGIPVQDADAVVHDLLTVHGDAVIPVSKLFPNSVKNDGYGDYIDRKIIGNSVFDDDHKLKQLEAILHPLVQKKRDSFIMEHKNAPAVVLDIPLLFENGIETMCDFVCVVIADTTVRDSRVLKRSNMTPEKLSNIIAKQMDDDIKLVKSDYVIRTDCDLDETQQQVQTIIQSIIG